MTEAPVATDAENPLINPDLAPVHPRDRTWRTGSYAALWESWQTDGSETLSP